MHLAHFNWGTLIAEVGDPAVAPFVDAVGRVNALAERADGFVWRSGDEQTRAKAVGWPLFDDPKVIASFSVWQSPEALKAFVYQTVHGAFYRRRAEWFEPDKGPNYALWWVPEGHIPDFAGARDKVEALIAKGPSEQVFDFDWLEAQVGATTDT
ncbi:MAG: DUF3291 domain-containing protein [Paracoccaceae bacterium]|nr:DUF3291 domain-containing protein [Paracoccaceae bacterium]